MGTKVKLSTALHPQTYGQAVCTNKTLEDMLRACEIDFKGNRDEHFPLIKFFYNNSYYWTIYMASFETLYGRICRYPLGWFEVGESSLLSPELVYETLEKVCVIRDRLKVSYIRQKYYVYNRIGDLEFEEGDKEYLKMLLMKRVMRFGKKEKLSPRYVGPKKFCKGYASWQTS